MNRLALNVKVTALPYTGTRYVHGVKSFGLMSLPVQLLNDFRSEFGLDRLCSRPRKLAFSHVYCLDIFKKRVINY